MRQNKKPLRSSQELIEESERGYINKNTERLQINVSQRFMGYLEEKEEKRDLTKIPTEDLDKYIVVFISRLKKKNGDPYLWNSFKTLVHSLISFLRRHWQQHQLEDYPTLDKLHRTQSTLDCNLKNLKEKT